MTTTVTVLIQGNKKCRVSVEEYGKPVPGQLEHTVHPGEFAQLYIHGDQKLVVHETGEFI